MPTAFTWFVLARWLSSACLVSRRLDVVNLRAGCERGASYVKAETTGSRSTTNSYPFKLISYVSQLVLLLPLMRAAANREGPEYQQYAGHQVQVSNYSTSHC